MDVSLNPPDERSLVLHQDAFAGGYDNDEYMLLGMAVKFAGLTGVSVTILGTNEETFRNGKVIEFRRRNQ